jgi:hypothetical protein
MAVPTPEGRPAALRPGAALVVGLIVLALAALLAGAVYLAGQLPWDGQPPADVVATPSQIVAQPSGFRGKLVTLTGATVRVIGRRAFTVGEDGGAGGELLVVAARPIAEPTGRTAEAPMARDDMVRLTGEVMAFELVSFERAAGADLDDGALRVWEGHPALLARTVEVSPRRAPAR